MPPFTLDLTPVVKLSDAQFDQLCAANPDIKFERTPKGEIVVMSPTGCETGMNNATLIARFVLWNESQALGRVFDSSTCFRMRALGGGDRSPDVSWVEKSRWEALSPEARRKFPPIAPDFVLELLSPTDTLYAAREKMMEYMAVGVRLGWLIDPEHQRVEIYRPGQAVESLERPDAIADKDILPGFELSLDWLWASQ